MLRKYRFLLPVGLVLLLAALVPLILQKQLRVEVDGQPRTIKTFALTVGGALRSAGLQAGAQDRLQPPADDWASPGLLIRLDRARPVTVFYRGVPLTTFSAERRPGLLLGQVGVPVSPDDRLYLDGQRVLPDMDLPPLSQYTLQVRQAVEIKLVETGRERVLKSAAATLGDALWENGIRLHAGDRLSLPASTPLSEIVAVELRRAVPVTIALPDRELVTRSAAVTTGQALAEAGVALQGLDYSQPEENAPLPADGRIKVVRVREDVLLSRTAIPFESKSQPDAETELGTKRVIQAGQPGIKVSRQRVRYENGVEVDRQTEAEWVASQPVAQIVGTGIKAVVKKLDTPDGQIEYYRAVTVYATSYSPCRQGMGKCSKSTSSGTPLTKGVVAVTLPWYNQLAGQRIYVPGYGVGVIADVGGGIPGTYWIDLGYDEENFVNWHENVTIYFLTPVPANVPVTLP